MNRKVKSLIKVLLKTKCKEEPSNLEVYFDILPPRGITLFNIMISDLQYSIEEEIKICIANSHIDLSFFKEWENFLKKCFNKEDIQNTFRSLNCPKKYKNVFDALTIYRIEYLGQCEIMRKRKADLKYVLRNNILKNSILSSKPIESIKNELYGLSLKLEQLEKKAIIC